MRKIFNASQIKKIDECTVGNQGISSIDLMERASLAIYNLLLERLDPQLPVFIFAGSGNNGGDALAVARMLLVKDYNLHIYLIGNEGGLSNDCKINKERLEHIHTVHIVNSEEDIPEIEDNGSVIDGIFGSGLNRPVEGIYLNVINKINNSKAKVYSIDIPSGMFVEDNSNNEAGAIVKADEVFTFQFPKLSMLLPDSNAFINKMTIVDIGLTQDCIEKINTEYYFLQKEDISGLLQSRSNFSHKGDFGRAVIAAGSYGKMGAAIMAAKACLRSGVGLLTMHIPGCGVDIMQAVVPEAMVDADAASDNISKLNQENMDKYTFGIGPGIGTKDDVIGFISYLFDNYTKPLVVDADALNIISENEYLKKKIPSKSILTPHPVEFERLSGKKFDNGYSRLQAARDFAFAFDVYIVLKGAYTAIVSPDKTVHFNSTGNPGMATGGSGDILTGIITSLLAQKYNPLDAARMGVYLHGLAADLAVQTISERSLLPSDIIENIGKAYLSLEK